MSEPSSPATTVAPAKQPNSRSCFVCGLENPYGLRLTFYETGPAEVTAETTIPDRYQGFPGVVHGGIVAAMLDEAAGRAAMIGDSPRFMVTAKLEVFYRSPVPIGTMLRIVGALERHRGRLAMATAQIVLPDGSLAANAEVLLADRPGANADPAQLEALGWKVYPD